MNFCLNDGYVTREDFCNMYGEEYCNDCESYYAKVEWVRAAKYCNDLSEKEGLEKCYLNIENLPEDGKGVVCDYEKNGYRLPTTEEARIEYAKDFFDEKVLGEAQWCDNLSLGETSTRGNVRLQKNSSWENRTLITDFSDTLTKLPFRIGKKKTFNETVLEDMPEIGRGNDKPLLIKDNMALFCLYNGDYALCYKGLGILKNFGKAEPKEIIEFLLEEGFKKVEL